MKKMIDIKALFKALITTEYELLKYILKTQGTESREIDFSAVSAALHVNKRALYSAHKRLVTVGAILADGTNFKINEKFLIEK